MRACGGGGRARGREERSAARGTWVRRCAVGPAGGGGWRARLHSAAGLAAGCLHGPAHQSGGVGMCHVPGDDGGLQRSPGGTWTGEGAPAAGVSEEVALAREGGRGRGTVGERERAAGSRKGRGTDHSCMLVSWLRKYGYGLGHVWSAGGQHDNAQLNSLGIGERGIQQPRNIAASNIRMILTQVACARCLSNNICMIFIQAAC